MDSTGKVLLAAAYTNISASGKYIFVARKEADGTTHSGLLNAQGKVLLEPIYYSIRGLGNRHFLVLKQDSENYSIYTSEE